MRTVSNHASEPNWAPITDETFDRLYDAYCAWCASTPVERAQLAHDAAQRRYNAFVHSVPHDDEVSIFERPEWQTLAADLVDALHVMQHAEARDRIPLPSVQYECERFKPRLGPALLGRRRA